MAATQSFELQANRALARCIEVDWQADPRNTAWIASMDKLFELCQKWQPPVETVIAVASSLSTVAAPTSIPLPQQMQFIQSLAKLRHIRAGNSDEALMNIDRLSSLLRSSNTWTVCVAVGLLRQYAHQLGFQGPRSGEALRKLMFLSERFRGMLVDVWKDYEGSELTKDCLLVAYTDIVVLWCRHFPNDLTPTKGLSPLQSISFLFSLLAEQRSSWFTVWIAQLSLAKLANSEVVWEQTDTHYQSKYLLLCFKILQLARQSKISIPIASAAMRSLNDGPVYSYVQQIPDYLSQILSAITCILAAFPNKLNLQTAELRFHCISFILHFLESNSKDPVAASAGLRPKFLPLATSASPELLDDLTDMLQTTFTLYLAKNNYQASVPVVPMVIEEW